MPSRRTWLPTPLFLPGESHGQRSLAGYSPWDPKELGSTEQPALSLLLYSWASQVALVVKNPPANAGDVRDLGSIPGLGRFHCRGKWQLTLVFLPGKSHEQRSLTGYSSTQSQRSEHDGVTNTFSLFFESKMKQVMPALLSSEHCNENHGHLHTWS